MKKANGISAALVISCAACVVSAASFSQSNVQVAPLSVHELYATHFLLQTEDVPVGITSGRARSLVGGVFGLVSLIIGGVAMARAGRIGTGNGRLGAMVALGAGLIGMVLSVVHLAGSTGIGTGGGRAGAIVALVLALIGMGLGGLALSRSLHTHL